MYNYPFLYPTGVQQTTTYNQFAYAPPPMGAPMGQTGAGAFMNTLSALMPPAQTAQYAGGMGPPGPAMGAGGYGNVGYSPITSSQVNQVITAVAQQNPALMQKIEAAANLDERLGAVAEIRDAMVMALNQAGYQANSTSSSDKLTVNGSTFDILNEAHKVGSKPSVQALRVNPPNQGTAATGSPYGYGLNESNPYASPYGPYNSYGSYGGMQGGGLEKLADALFALAEALGYEAPESPAAASVASTPAAATSAPSTGLAHSGGSSATSPSSPINLAAKEIVLRTGAANQNLLSKINTAATEPERLAYARELQDNIVAALNEAGLAARTTDSPDKIEVLGQTYDILNSIQQLKAVAAIQFLPVSMA